jgi:hypothetical protein
MTIDPRRLPVSVTVTMYPWNPAGTVPPERGWYECRSTDDRWDGGTRYRSYGRGMWWIPLGDGTGDDGWLSSPPDLYEWRGPAYDVMGPPPKTDRQMADAYAGIREAAGLAPPIEGEPTNG